MKTLPTLLALLLLTAVSLAAPEKGNQTVMFGFAPGKDMFTLRGNEAELSRLYSLIDEYRSEITAGRMPLHVDGYCASLPIRSANLRTAYLRANRVKSELITRKGLTEADFVTGNYAHAYHNNKDVVIVTLRLPAKETPEPQETAPKDLQQEEPPIKTEPRPEPKVEKEAEPQPEPIPEPVAEMAYKPAGPEKPYCFAIRTNVLYDALLLPTLGVEWRINHNIGIKLDGSLAWWAGSSDKVQKMWIISPEVRWYLLKNKRFYTGISGNFSQYNIYKYAIGGFVSKNTGYQGSFRSTGLTVGYQLTLPYHFIVDFNLGLGYTRLEYDSFTITDDVRVYKERDCTKNCWGPTQAGVSLMWTLGGKK